MVGIVDRIERSVEDFRGDTVELAAMMRSSWGAGAGPPYLYTAELLEAQLAAPGVTGALRAAIYRDGRLQAFALGCPRTVTIDGAPRRIVISAFLTAAQHLKHAGLGILVWGGLMLRARRAGFDGAIHYCEVGGPMHGMIEGAAQLLELPLIRVASFDQLVAPVPPSTPAPAPPDPHAWERLVAANAAAARPGIRRAWTSEQARWALDRPGEVLVLGDGGSILAGTVATVDDPAATRLLVVDSVVWGTLPAPDRPALVRELMRRAGGARAITVSDLPGTDRMPFRAAGFVPAGHITDTYLTQWSDPDARPGSGFDLDVV